MQCTAGRSKLNWTKTKIGSIIKKIIVNQSQQKLKIQLISSIKTSNLTNSGSY